MLIEPAGKVVWTNIPNRGGGVYVKEYALSQGLKAASGFILVHKMNLSCCLPNMLFKICLSCHKKKGNLN